MPTFLLRLVEQQVLSNVWSHALPLTQFKFGGWMTDSRSTVVGFGKRVRDGQVRLKLVLLFAGSSPYSSIQMNNVKNIEKDLMILATASIVGVSECKHHLPSLSL